MTVGVRLARALVVCGLLSFGLSWGAPDAAAADPAAAAAFVERLGNQAIETLAKPSLGPDEAKRRFRALFRDGFDLPWISRFVLARYWRVATAAQRAEFVDLFEKLIIETYSLRFSEYSGETMRIVSAQPRGRRGDVFVDTEIRRPGGPAVGVEWVVRGTRDGLKIIDIIVEQVSMGVTQRQEFASVIQRQGGRVEALLELLRGKVGSATTG